MSASRKELLSALRALVENPRPEIGSANHSETYRRYLAALGVAMLLLGNEEDWMDEHYAQQARDAEDEGRW